MFVTDVSGTYLSAKCEYRLWCDDENSDTMRYTSILTSVSGYYVPDLSGLLWLHVVTICPPPPHVHSQMP